MALGDDALAAGMDVVDPNADRREGADEITKTRDYLANGTMKSGAITTGKIADAAITTPKIADGAVTVDKVDTYTDPTLGVNKIPRYNSTGKLACNDPTAPLHTANKQYVDGAVAGVNLSSRVAKSGDTMTGSLVISAGHLFTPGSSAATDGYVVAYINSDGRLSRGASSERYKHDINRAPELPDVLSVPIASYVMDTDPNETPRYGPIAEDLADNPATAPFVVHNERGEPEAFDVISYLMAAVGTLHARNAELLARLERLEERDA